MRALISRPPPTGVAWPARQRERGRGVAPRPLSLARPATAAGQSWLRLVTSRLDPELQGEVGQRQAADVLGRQPEVAGAAPVADGRGRAADRLQPGGGDNRGTGLGPYGLGQVGVTGVVAE